MLPPIPEPDPGPTRPGIDPGPGWGILPTWAPGPVGTQSRPGGNTRARPLLLRVENNFGTLITKVRFCCRLNGKTHETRCHLNAGRNKI